MDASSPQSSHHRLAVFVRNGFCTTPSFPKRDFLTKWPRGAYTTARTVRRGRAVFEFEMHVQRMCDSSTSLVKESETLTPQKKQDILKRLTFEQLRPVLAQTISAGLTFLVNEPPASKEATEYQLTALMTWDESDDQTPPEQGYDLYCYIEELTPISQTVQAEVRRGGRVNASTKDSKWVRDRRQLEEAKASDSNEVVMCDEHGHISEGLSSNFFAIRRSPEGLVIETAPEDMVLAGTVRKVIFDVAHNEGWPVVLRTPSVREAKNGLWEACCVTSTSRLVKPVHTLLLPEEDPPSHIDFDKMSKGSGLLELLAMKVRAAAEEQSTVLVGWNGGGEDVPPS
ncbi:unnamed protein product [Vitrella brassicaformis CCMP3155]|uniref:D-aminoacid aminotransferase-like PLP-dependent enzyme n=1 Tax=Vitrella brassicaformis (strain CCMP3155) TaxID=1169540 RepID=A0A0G4GIU8_VITBC|nr:unnamed protein product [Vitrella brassicaformis CCMP3155]|eukprot:CEM29767.1 unnamed protein product [Vitrella brassicaformis CCMP3155]